MSRADQSLGTALSALPENLLRDPLEYLKADHFRQDTMRTMLGDGGAPGLSPDALRTLRGYLETDLPRHLADEDDDLFPMLKRRAPRTSPLHDVIAVLSDGHARLRVVRERVVREFESAAPHGRWPDSSRFFHLLGTFGELNRWTVLLEEKIVIPAAREYLDRPSLFAIAEAMSRRRDVPLPDVIN